jgi:hypothetical protein
MLVGKMGWERGGGDLQDECAEVVVCRGGYYCCAVCGPVEEVSLGHLSLRQYMQKHCHI